VSRVARRNIPGAPAHQWEDEGPRPSTGATGVGWPLGPDSGQEAARVNAVDMETSARPMPLSPDFLRHVGLNVEPEGIR
jgi:hypothetical protein